jgi:hypothetical protein
MKAIVWLVFLVLTAFWTGLVALTEQLSQWLLASMASGQVGELATVAGQWPVPAWLGFWVDTAWLQGLQDAGVGLVQWLGQVLPSSQGLMSWISPLLWLGWGLGALLLLVAAVMGHMLLGQRWSAPRKGLKL